PSRTPGTAASPSSRPRKPNWNPCPPITSICSVCPSSTSSPTVALPRRHGDDKVFPSGRPSWTTMGTASTTGGAWHMSDNKDKQRSEADAEIEREIRKERKFTLAEAIGRMAGPGAMKGVSPVTRKQQAVVEIQNWLRYHMAAANGELQVVLL